MSTPGFEYKLSIRRKSAQELVVEALDFYLAHVIAPTEAERKRDALEVIEGSLDRLLARKTITAEEESRLLARWGGYVRPTMEENPTP